MGLEVMENFKHIVRGVATSQRRQNGIVVARMWEEYINRSEIRYNVCFNIDGRIEYESILEAWLKSGHRDFIKTIIE